MAEAANPTTAERRRHDQDPRRAERSRLCAIRKASAAASPARAARKRTSTSTARSRRRGSATALSSTSDTALLEVSAEFRADLSTNTDQGFVAAVAFNDATSTTRITNGHTSAEIGSQRNGQRRPRAGVGARRGCRGEGQEHRQRPVRLRRRQSLQRDRQRAAEARSTHLRAPAPTSMPAAASTSSPATTRCGPAPMPTLRTIGITGNVIATASNDKRVDVQVNVDSGVHIDDQHAQRPGLHDQSARQRRLHQDRHGAGRHRTSTTC